MTDGRGVLQAGAVVVLVDWPSQEVPRSLLAAGLTVLSVNHVRGTASSYSIAADEVAADDGVDVLPGERRGDGALVIRRLDDLPVRADVVCVYRPAAELAAIARLAVALQARAFWVQGGGIMPDDARGIADAAGLRVVEGVSIADAARQLAAGA